jgi:hypothetical protein
VYRYGSKIQGSEVVAIPPWAARIRCARVEPERGNERRKIGVGLALTLVIS